MTDLLEFCIGLDIHRDVIVACLLKGELGTKPVSKVRSFTTLIPGMIFGASGRNIMRYLFTHGQISLEALDGCLKTRHKINDIMIA